MAAHCDIESGKVYGVIEGTKEWFHEEGHLVFNESERGSTLHLYQKYLLHGWMLWFSASPLMGRIAYYIGMIALFGYFGIEMYEELWCEKYAKTKIKEVKDGKTNS